MHDRTYVYAIYIATTPEKLWQALTSNEFIEKYWKEWRIESDWKEGSPVKFFTADGTLFSEGEVMESNPPNKLSYTWPDPEVESAVLPERLTWEIIESGSTTVKLKLTHERISDKYYPGVSEGWPLIISSLKSLIEVGSPLAFASQA